MGIKLLHTNTGNEFFDLLNDVKESIYIMCPFISYATANRLATWIEESDNKIDCKIITRFNREEFIQGANSIKGLDRLLEVGVELYALQHLHSKLYIFDKKNLIMGSANFTLSGLFKNHELGIIVKQEAEFSNQCVEYFNQILNKILDFKVTKELIDKEIEHVTRSTINRGKMKKSSNPVEYSGARWGAILDENENSIQSNKDYDFKQHFDILEDVVAKEEVIEGISGARIKFEGNSENRVSNKEIYVERKKLLHEYLNRTFYPHKPTSIDDDELIFIAMVSKDRFGNPTPMIVGYAYTFAFEDINIINDNDSNYHKWNGRYPYYIEFTNGKFIKTPIENGISLIELCNELKHKVYPGTINTPEIAVTDILKRHHQKAHIRITNEAKNYLKARLDKIFEEQGYDSIL
ncbi:phospholipase D family protein [Lysinibacillus endophyticus]|uniref:phospholipase D family protein n=1 Tax=Ureibacillus endophyticus TaxID=1978490 RepID=UPI0031360BBD